MTFYPDNSGDWFTFFLGLTGALLGSYLTYVLVKGRIGGTDVNRRNLGAMLSFFVAMMGLGTALFTGWFLYRMQPVTIEAGRLDTGFGRYEIANVSDARIVTDTRRSFVNPNVTTGSDRILVIEFGASESIAFPSEKYDVEGILQALRREKGVDRE